VVEAWLDEALRLAPRDPAMREVVARFCLQRGLDRKGLHVAWMLVGLEPESGVAHDLLGEALLRNGEPEKAKAHLLQAIERDPRLAPAYFHLGAVYLALGDVERARPLLLRALDLNTDPTLRQAIEPLLASATHR